MQFKVREKGLFLAIALITILFFVFILSPGPQTQASLDDTSENEQSTTEVQPGIFVYTVLNNENNFTIKNRDGIIELNTNDASTAINYALNMISSGGGRVFLTTGDYLISNTLRISSNSILEGEAIDDVNDSGFGTRLIASSNLQGPILSNMNPRDGDSIITLKNLSFDGGRSNKELKNGSYGILFTKTTRCRIIDVAVYKCKDSGIVFDGSQGTVEAMIERVSSRGNNNAGLHMKTQSDFHIYNSEFGSNQGEGILLSTCSSGSIIGTNVFLNQRVGILLYNTMNMRISDNRVNDNGYSGIEITSTTTDRADYNTLNGNICYNNGQNLSQQAGIKLYSNEATVSNCLIASNVCYDNQNEKTQDYGIFEQLGAYKNFISGNLCVNNKIQNIKLSESTFETSKTP